MAKFTHYLVTRFNIRIDGLGPENFRPSARTESWVSDRMPLFESFCAPSVAGQMNKDFHWLIYCDPTTDEIFLNRISVAIQNVSSYEIVFVSDFKEMLSHLRNKISEADTPHVITSRLDNADGIGINYIHDVQAHFTPEGNVVLNLLGGINYNASQGILTFNHYAINN